MKNMNFLSMIWGLDIFENHEARWSSTLNLRPGTWIMNLESVYNLNPIPKIQEDRLSVNDTETSGFLAQDSLGSWPGSEEQPGIRIAGLEVAGRSWAESTAFGAFRLNPSSLGQPEISSSKFQISKRKSSRNSDSNSRTYHSALTRFRCATLIKEKEQKEACKARKEENRATGKKQSYSVKYRELTPRRHYTRLGVAEPQGSFTLIQHPMPRNDAKRLGMDEAARKWSLHQDLNA
ncbi:hypothetical protein PIB30_081918 [Stylosanthes scabra]|uniref:Uncharacterized protein n=1 Tax=Stylosanthes scabra TaxID=79078 RepID=A0ABU6RRT5_9FABA|nr:hypothetical protein [Stylosanthes scabra]